MSGLTAAAPAIAMGPTSMAMVINPIEAFFNTLNTNPFFIGIMMLLLNLGGRFLGMEISKNQERFMQQPWVRRFFIFTVLFVATRNILAAFFLTIVILVFLAYLLNENSDLYLGPKEPAEKTPSAAGLTVEETEILRRLTEKQQRMTKATENGTADGEQAKKEIPVEEIYMENMYALQEAK